MYIYIYKVYYFVIDDTCLFACFSLLFSFFFFTFIDDWIGFWLYGEEECLCYIYICMYCVLIINNLNIFKFYFFLYFIFCFVFVALVNCFKMKGKGGEHTKQKILLNRQRTKKDYRKLNLPESTINWSIRRQSVCLYRILVQGKRKRGGCRYLTLKKWKQTTAAHLITSVWICWRLIYINHHTSPLFKSLFQVIRPMHT